MTRYYYFIISSVLVVALILASLFIVEQRKIALIFQFGEAVRVIDKPGLNYKIPFIQNVRFFDKRILNVTAEAKELTAADGKRIIIDAFAKFKITDSVTFFKTVQNYEGAMLRLNKILESSMRKVIGRVNLSVLLTDERSKLMLLIKKLVDDEAKSFGVYMIDTRIMRADLPKENSAAIYRRMQTEREKEAKQIRAEGQEEKEIIRSTADKESKIIIATAYAEAERVKGEGDFEATKIYNKSYGKDPEFYKFYRTLLSYKNSFNQDNTTFVLPQDSQYLKYLNISK